MVMKRFEVDLDALTELKYGVKVIAFTFDPAIVEKGVALSSQKNKRIIFSDSKKMQIIAPLLIPMDVYRYDNEDGEYEITFTAEAVEKITKQMMRNLPQSGLKSIFTDEHTEDFLDAYIFELTFIDTKEKQTMLKNQYGLNLPMNSTCVNVQCDNRKTYDYLVENGKIGLSIDGLFKLNEITEKQNKMSKKNKVTLTKKVKYREGFFKFKSDRKRKAIAFEADAIVEKEEITVHDEEGAVIEDWTGEITVVVDGDETVIEVVEDEIVSVTVEGEEPTEGEEKKDEVEMSDEEVTPIPVSAPNVSVAEAVAEAVAPILEKLIAIEQMLSSKIADEIEEDKDDNVQMSSKKEGFKKNLSILINKNK